MRSCGRLRRMKEKEFDERREEENVEENLIVKDEEHKEIMEKVEVLR
jgi:hypothetical protein